MFHLKHVPFLCLLLLPLAAAASADLRFPTASAYTQRGGLKCDGEYGLFGVLHLDIKSTPKGTTIIASGTINQTFESPRPLALLVSGATFLYADAEYSFSLALSDRSLDKLLFDSETNGKYALAGRFENSQDGKFIDVTCEPAKFEMVDRKPGTATP